MKHVLTSCLFFLLPILLWSQNCGLERSVRLPANTTDTVPLAIFDLVRNDLADPDQGVCSVDLNFLHNSVGTFEVWLESPSGQQVQLIGPVSSAPISGLGFSYDVTFLAERLGTAPTNGQWDNDVPSPGISPQPFTGEFFPYQGRLDDFDAGPVNGTWFLIVQTSSASIPLDGLLVDVKVNFCDPLGENCCFAEGGAFAMDSTTVACAGSPDLLLDPDLDTTIATADSLQYGYTWLLTRDSIVLAADTLNDWRSLPAGAYQLFGLSYSLADQNNLPVFDSTLHIDSLRNQLDRPVPPFCGDLTTNSWTLDIVAASDTTFQTEILCVGDTIAIGDTVTSEPGEYIRTLRNEAGCDSVVVYDVQLSPVFDQEIDSVICAGDTITFGGNQFFEPGIYRDTLQSRDGCDSLVTLFLDVITPTRDTITQLVCNGQSVSIGGESFNTTGIHTVVLPGASGCDSILVLDLSVLSPQALVADGPRDITCADASIMLDGSASQPMGEITYLWERQTGPFTVDVVGTDPTLTVTEPGRYFLQVTARQDSVICSDRTTGIDIAADTTGPLVEAGPDRTLTCSQTTAVLGSGLVVDGPNTEIRWRAENGVFPGDSTIARPVVTEPGWYFLLVTNLRNGCTGIDSVRVLDNRPTLEVALGPDQTITCGDTSLSLQSTVDPPGPDYAYFWYEVSESGTELSDQSMLSVAEPGTYVLSVTDPGSGCSEVDSVVVTIDTLRPTVQLATPADLTCSDPTAIIDGTSSLLVGTTEASWTSLNGSTFQPLSDLSIIVDTAGTYQLQLLNTENGCLDTASVTVSDERTPVVARLSPVQNIDCGRPVVRLDAGTSEPLTSLAFEWSTSDGVILDGNREAIARVNAAGTYALLVTDTISGCSDSLSTMVIADTMTPAINLQADGVLSCGKASVMIENAAAESRGIMFSYNWSGPCIAGPDDQETLVVNCAGTYSLTVTNLRTACVSPATITIDSIATSPEARLTQDTFGLSCSDGRADLDTGPSQNGTTSWYRNGVLLSMDPVFTVSDTGEYLLVVEDATLGCRDSATAVVEVDCEPFAQIIDPAPLSCALTRTTLDASPSEDGNPLSYLWRGPEAGCLSDSTDQVVDVRCPGLYTLIVTNTAVGQSDTTTAEVERNTDAPFADAGPDQELRCDQTRVVLDGRNSDSGPAFSYIWLNAAGDTLSQSIQFETGENDTYVLEVLDSETGCRSEDVVTVTRDAALPDIRFGSRFFPCETDTFSFEAFVFPEDRTYLYQWSGSGLTGVLDQAVVQITDPGTYSLLVTDTANACSVSESFIIEEQSCGPCATIITPDTLTCVQSEVRLTAELCAPCTSCTYEWSTAEGSILTDPLAAAINVGEPGLYELRVTDSSGITTVLTAEVFINTIAPAADAGPDQLLDCLTSEVLLGQELVPAGDSLSYTWLTTSSDTIPSEDGARVLIGASGTYLLRVRDLRNGCTSQDDVVVRENSNAPTAQAGDDQMLDCDEPVLRLNGQGSSEGANIIYQWTTDDGQIRTGASSLNPLVEGPGVYLLRVTDTLNNCGSLDSIRILAPTDFPTLSSLDTQYIGCGATDVFIEAPIVDTAIYLYTWTDESGMFLSGERTLSTSLPGTYELEVTNTQNGCSNQAEVDVVVLRDPPDPDLPIADTLTCDQLDVLLDAQLPVVDYLQYSWTTARGLDLSMENGPSIRITESDSVFLRVEDLRTGCFALDTTVVRSSNGRPVIRAPEQDFITCARPTVDLRLSLGGDLSDYAFSWETEDGQIEGDATIMGPTVSEPGRYILTTTNVNSGCQSELFVIVDADRRSPSATIIGGDSLGITCTDREVLLDAFGSSVQTNGSPVFDWQVISGPNPDGDMQSAQVFATGPGALQLTVTDTVNGCTDILDVVIADNTQPPAEPELAAGNPISCANEQTTISILNQEEGMFYTGIFAGDSTALPNGVWTVVEPGQYTVEVTSTTSGCTNEAVISVTQNFARPELLIQPTGTLGCSGNPVLLELVDARERPLAGIQWDGPDGGLIAGNNPREIEGVLPGTYTVMAFDSITGCVGQTSISLEALESTIDSILWELEPPACGEGRGTTLRITGVSGGTGPYLYALSPPGPLSTNTVFPNLSPGNLTIRVEDANGCTLDQNITITNEQAPLSIDLGDDEEIILGDSIDLVPLISGTIETRRWISEGRTISTEAELRVSPKRTTVYRLEGITADGCVATDDITVFVREDLGIYLPNVFAPGSSNPQNQVFYVQASERVEEVISFQIYDRWGELLYVQESFPPNDPTMGWDGTHGGDKLNGGVFVYFIKVRLRGNREEILKGDVTLLR